MNKKKVVLIIILLILVIATLIYFKTIKLDGKDNSINENTIENNTIDNNKLENEIDNKNETVSVNASNNEKIADPNQEIDKNEMQKQESNQEKAINIAKEEWGNDNSVEFTFDHIDDKGRYIIFIRDINTTRQIDEYIVDINLGKIVK